MGARNSSAESASKINKSRCCHACASGPDAPVRPKSELGTPVLPSNGTYQEKGSGFLSRQNRFRKPFRPFTEFQMIPRRSSLDYSGSPFVVLSRTGSVQRSLFET